MRPVLVFDVLGTLLDTGSLDPARLDRLVRLAMTATILEEFRPFEELAVEALGVTAPERLRELPAHADVSDALERLAGAGYAMHALTNGSRDATRAALANAGIAQYFRDVHSAQACETYKPDVRVYRTTLVRIDVEPDDAVMISAHDWDVAGARRHGMRTRWITRPDHGLGKVADELIFFPVTSGAV